jgi:hypothetical protein
METEHLSADSESSFIHIEIDPEDYKGASPDDAIHDLLHPYEVNWPNDAYREFMEIISKHQLSNSVGDAFIKFFNKHSNLDVSPLPPTTKFGKEFLDNSTIPHMTFKEIPIITFQGVNYTFYYRSLIKTIKSLLMIDSINQQLVLKFVNKREIRNNVECRIFEEQYNCLWWEREESSLLPGQRLLSIILYSDATALDHMGKSSGHPIFLSLGNISIWNRFYFHIIKSVLIK